MKVYKTWEAIKILQENPTTEFKDKTGRILKLTSELNKLHILTVNHFFNIDAEWTLIQKPVPFMEAIRALDEGKDIYCEIDSGKLHYKSGISPNGYYAVLDEFEGPITTKEILQGKWYIEED